MPNLTVLQPPANLVVQLNRPFLISGQASDKGMPEPVMIDSVTVQVDDGPVVDASLTHLPNRTVTLVSFKAFAQVTGGSDPHTVTVTATNDNGVSVTKTVSVFTGVAFEVDYPAVLVDIVFPFPIDLASPPVQNMIAQFQLQLGGMSAMLRSAGKVLIGPNLFLDTTSAGIPVLRIGLWIEDSKFPVLRPSGRFSLPRLPEEGAIPSFALVPLLPVPTLNPLSFALSIPLRTLQGLLDALAPVLIAAASQQGASLDSLSIQLNQSGSITTSFSGSGALDIPFSVSVTETLGTKFHPDAQPPQHVPAVVGSSHSASVLGIPDWVAVFSAFVPLLGVFALAAVDLGGQVSGQVYGLMQSLFDAIPSRVPFSNAMLALPSLPDFPVFVPDWRTLGGDSTGILGTGTATIEARDQSMVDLRVLGPGSIRGYQEELAGGAGFTYGYALVNLSPDPDKLRWQVSGTAPEGGAIARSTFDQGGSFGAFFPLPLHVVPKTYPFDLTVHATETCGTDPRKTLTAEPSKPVNVVVLANPKLPPR